MCSTAPVEVLETTGVTPTARCLGMMTETLVASAVRKIDPRLCGSAKLSRINKRVVLLAVCFRIAAKSVVLCYATEERSLGDESPPLASCRFFWRPRNRHFFSAAKA